MAGLSHNFLILAIFSLQIIISLYSDPENHKHIKVKLFTHAFYLIFLFQKIVRKLFDFPLIVSFFVEPALVYLMWVSKSPVVMIYTFWTFGLYAALVYLLQILDFPKTTGKFLVGYKDIFIENIGNVAVFYPTDQISKDVPWLTDRKYLETLLDAAFHKHFPFLIREIFLFAFGFLQAIPMGVHKDARLAQGVEKLDVMVFSHGLGGNRHGYSIFLREMASNGFVIFASDHPEKIIILPHFNIKDINKYVPTIKEVRGSQLERRKETITVILDYVYDLKKMKELFKRDVPVNYEKLMLGGHSFGGITSIYTSLLDNRVKGGLICLDPYIFPMKDEFLSKNVKLPILAINTESFDGSIKYAENMKRLDKIFNGNSEKNRSINLICRRSDHLHQCDLVFFFSEFMKLIKFINRKGDVLTITEINSKVMLLFMNEVVMKEKNKEEVLEKIKNCNFRGVQGREVLAVQ